MPSAPAAFDLSKHGITVTEVYRNASPAFYYETALRYERGSSISSTGSLIAYSGKKTGRSPTDKRIVDEAESSGDIWWGNVNIKLEPAVFRINRERAVDYLNTRERLYCVDAYAGWDPKYRLKIRVICARAYHALFMHNMLIRPTPEQLQTFGEPDYVIYNAGQFPANRHTAGMTSQTSIDLSFANREFVILGSEYAGEMKKGVFTIMNYLMPKQAVLSMHCPATAAKDVSITENTRGSYPIDGIWNARIPCVGGHPKNVIFLTCDAFGVLPPVSKLSPAQAMYHFISGYTAKVAGTEVGVKEPSATFSPCFGGPFMVWHPGKYAELLAEKLKKHGAQTWLVNTGWSGGGFGVGSRMKLKFTRAIVDAIHAGTLHGVKTVEDPVFGLQVPTSCPEVPSEILVPRNTWGDKAAYDEKALKVASLFRDNFKKYESGVSEEVRAAGPRL
jgi:ATP-dependent phosphoenolpyruvate carboxykinase